MNFSPNIKTRTNVHSQTLKERRFKIQKRKWTRFPYNTKALYVSDY